MEEEKKAESKKEAPTPPKAEAEKREKIREDLEKKIDTGSFWSMKTIFKNVALFMMVVFLDVVGLLIPILTGMFLASLLAGFVWKTKPEKLDEKQTIICKGFIYLTLKMFGFAALTGLALLL